MWPLRNQLRKKSYFSNFSKYQLKRLPIMAILKLWFTIDNWNSFSLLYVLVMWFIYGAIFHGDGIVFSNNSFCWLGCYTAQKMKSSIKDFVSKCDQIRSFPMENFIVQFYSLLLKYQFLRRSKNLSSSLVLAIILSKQNDKTFFEKLLYVL